MLPEDALYLFFFLLVEAESLTFFFGGLPHPGFSIGGLLLWLVGAREEETAKKRGSGLGGSASGA